MKILYAIPTHHCNLSCPHCTIKDAEEHYDHEKFMQALNSFQGAITLFGGEPTSNRKRMMDVIQSNMSCPGAHSIGSIATNLIILDDELIELYKKIKYISSSWNYTRFTDEEYKIWLRNLKICADNGIKLGIIITLTDDLLKADIEEFLKTVDEWPSDAITWIRFEHWISESNTPDYYEEADQWLCDVYKRWRSPIYVKTFDKSIKWYYECSETYTLEPDGTLHNTCPNGLYVKRHMVDDCYTCSKASECKPCRLQCYCSYPNRLRELIESEV